MIGLLLYAATTFAAPRVLVMGDSLSAGFGLEANQGWVVLLEQRMAQEGFGRWQVINASVSGETTDGGVARLPGLLVQYKPAVVIVELGGNDGLRALPLQAIRANLTDMVKRSRDAGARVVLVGMRIPPNYGPAYANGFAAIYTDLSRTLQVPLVPFLLEGVAGHADLMQADQIHANAAAQPRLLDNVWPKLKPLLR